METRADDVTTPTGLTSSRRGVALPGSSELRCRLPALRCLVSAIDLFCAGNGPVPFATKLDKPASSGAHSVRTAVYRLPLRTKVSDGCQRLLKA